MEVSRDPNRGGSFDGGCSGDSGGVGGNGVEATGGPNSGGSFDGGCSGDVGGVGGKAPGGSSD